MTFSSDLDICINRLVEAIITKAAGNNPSEIDPGLVDETIAIIDSDLASAERTKVWANPVSYRTTIERLIRERAFQASFRRKLLASFNLGPRSSVVRVFLSYRRTESKDLVRHIAASLRQISGLSVFVDETSLGEGLFPEQLGAYVNSSDVFVLVVTATTFDRMAAESDWVRREIETALVAGKRIILLRINNAAIPNQSSLPDPLKPLVAYNALDFYPAQFGPSLERLCDWLKR